LKVINIGEIVRINNEGTGGWLLLKKVDDQATTELTVNYKVIGRQNGTIQFNSNLYLYAINNVGYDGLNYDTDFFDNQPKDELRIILNCIKTDLFVDELEVEYNKLFFASLRYAMSEQLFIDWAFKTSFVKSKHNLGELQKVPTFQPNNLASYESYVNEVKPYRTKIREFVSCFDRIENTHSSIADFDLPARYNFDYKTIVPFYVKVENDRIAYDSELIFQKPYIDWYDNAGHSVTEIKVVDGGTGYRYAPKVRIEGACSETATAVAYISRGSVNKIIVTNPGSGYLETPQVMLDGSPVTGGSLAKAIAISGNSLIRNMNVGLKFDRISPTYQIQTLNAIETFEGTGSRSKFKLKWPIDIKTTSTIIVVNEEEKLFSDYKIYNELDTSVTYERYTGVVEFLNPGNTVPPLSTITVSYKKDITLLDAADRIRHFYDPKAGQIGKELGQLMTGVDYGGVAVTGLKFEIGAGWDALPWMVGGWDLNDPNYTDHLVRFDKPIYEIDRTFKLPYVPEVGEIINIYLNNVRIDDTDIMPSVVGDGVIDVIVLPETATYLTGVSANEVVFRKSTSDGSFMSSASTYDVEISNGNFDNVNGTYTTATGLNPEDIDIDGDGFVTPTTSRAPEEVVPGHVVDALDINVIYRNEGGVPLIETRYYTIADTTELNFAIGQNPGTVDAVIVKVNNELKVREFDYNINFLTQEVEFLTPLTIDDFVVITSMQQAGINMLDVGTIIADGSTRLFLSNANTVPSYSIFVTVNGTAAEVSIVEELDFIGFSFVLAPSKDSVISYTIVGADVNSISKAEREQITYNGNDRYYLTVVPGVKQPFEPNVLVQANGKLLRPSEFFNFEVTGNVRIYKISSSKYAYNTIETSDIEVYLNDKMLNVSTDYAWTSATNELRIKRGVAKAGDNIVLEIRKNAQYIIHYFTASAITLQLTEELEIGTKVYVTTFTNHNILNIERTRDVVNSASELIPGTQDYYTFNQLTAGRIKLRRPAVSTEYVWVSHNGTLLTANIDYMLEETKQHIRLGSHISIAMDDIFDVIAFGNDIGKPAYGFSIFKDMLNQTEYKREGNNTYLETTLNYYDTSIVVSDGSMLAQPVVSKNIPGVIFIGSERIEYYEKQGKVLTKIRRGTLGTGIKQVHIAGSKVLDRNVNNLVPYKDDVLTTVYDVDSIEKVTNFIEVPFTVLVDESSVGPNNTWVRSTIANNFGQCNEVEVFVAGRRLSKTPKTVWNVNATDNIESVQEAEFSVEYVVDSTGKQTGTTVIKLTTTPEIGMRVLVQKKVGKTWTPAGVSLIDATTVQANFIRKN
jgi:hypothetical protein